VAVAGGDRRAVSRNPRSLLQAKSEQQGSAAALEISEETVRQRLARGRQMLREQVAAMLERNLARSAPNAQFASAVIAALPALVAQSAAAGAAGGVAKAGGSAKGIAGAAVPGDLDWADYWIAGGHLRNCAQHPRYRDSTRAPLYHPPVDHHLDLRRLGHGHAVCADEVGQKFHWDFKTTIIAQGSFWLVYCVALVWMVLKWNRAHQALRRKEGLTPMPAYKMSPRLIS